MLFERLCISSLYNPPVTLSVMVKTGKDASLSSLFVVIGWQCDFFQREAVHSGADRCSCLA